MTPQQANELLGYLNVKYGTFFRPAELAATERTRELIESGEIIEVRRAPAPTSEPGAREYGAAVGWNDAITEAVAICSNADKSAHPADLADEIRALATPASPAVPEAQSRRHEIFEHVNDQVATSMRKGLAFGVHEPLDDWTVMHILAAFPDMAKAVSMADVTGFAAAVRTFAADPAPLVAQASKPLHQVIADWDALPYAKAGPAPEASPLVEDAQRIVAGKVEGWQSITAPGQVKVGDKLRFNIGDEKFSGRVKQIINEGRADEELIYNKRKNYYVITRNVLSGFGNVKNCQFLRATTGNATADDGKDKRWKSAKL